MLKYLKIYFIFVFTVVIDISAQTQINYRLYSEKSQTGTTFYADNEEYYPISIKMNFELTNMRIKGDNNSLFVVPPKTKKHFIEELIVINPKKPARNAGDSKVYPGNSTLNEYDKDFLYYLPFNKDQKFTVSQGYFGKSTHQGENCLDFNMPEGTEISAMREGLVVKVVNENDRHCFSKSCARFNNYITIMHSDGTFAEYTHLQKNGNIVNEGDTVKIGQHIGFSGNTGYSNNPHLHVVVYRQKLDKRITLVTKFLTGNGEKSEILKENSTYIRTY